MRPGDGEDFVYSLVDVNATLHCAVNNTYLLWVVDGIFPTSEVHRRIFDHSKLELGHHQKVGQHLVW